jgi:hypothetical protein
MTEVGRDLARALLMQSKLDQADIVHKELWAFNKIDSDEKLRETRDFGHRLGVFLAAQKRYAAAKEILQDVLQLCESEEETRETKFVLDQVLSETDGKRTHEKKPKKEWVRKSRWKGRHSATPPRVAGLRSQRAFSF